MRNLAVSLFESMQDDAVTPSAARKADGAFKTISEVGEDLDLPAHVLRFWETKFQQIQPLKRGGGRRYYTPADVMLIGRIRDLLHHQGYTIRGVQQLLKAEEKAARQQGGQAPSRLPVSAGLPEMASAANDSGATVMVARNELLSLRDELAAIRADLEAIRQSG